MLKPEEFSQQLEKALAGKQKAEQEAAAAKTLRRQQQEVERQERTSKEELEERQRNQAVLELDAQLPIRQYLETLRDKIAPEQEVKKWGPNKGGIAYTFVFNEEEREIVIDTKRWPGGGRTPETYQSFKETRKTHDVLGLVLDSSSYAKLGIWQCAEKGEKEGKYYPESENPWDFRRNYSMLAKERGFMLSNIKERVRFVRALTDFYLAFEAGQVDKAFRPLA